MLKVFQCVSQRQCEILQHILAKMPESGKMRFGNDPRLIGSLSSKGMYSNEVLGLSYHSLIGGTFLIHNVANKTVPGFCVVALDNPHPFFQVGWNDGECDYLPMRMVQADTAFSSIVFKIDYDFGIG